MPLPKPFRRGYPHRIRQTHRYYAIGGANGTAITMVVVFVG